MYSKVQRSVYADCVTYAKSRIDFNHIINTFINVETRYIEMSLDTARRMYERGGEFREIALGAFTEQELVGDRLPKTWKEYCATNDRKNGESWINFDSSFDKIMQHEIGKRNPDTDKNLLPNLGCAKAHLALMQLHQLRDCYRQGWKPSFRIYYGITRLDGELLVSDISMCSCFLSFQTKELAEEFLNNFRELIVEAGDLI